MDDKILLDSDLLIKKKNHGTKFECLDWSINYTKKIKNKKENFEAQYPEYF